jgi:alpha-beta hydrolase superfamily lysophospholipase
MPPSTFPTGLSLITSLGTAPFRLQALVRQTEERWRPRKLAPHQPKERRAQTAVLGAARAAPADAATILREKGAGRTPTIVLGGFVPDATEQVFLLRRFLLKAGDLLYIQYPRDGFSLDLLCAQLTDLVRELGAAGRPPAILAVSFGAGLVLEWLRRHRVCGSEPLLAGVVLISPVSCRADLLGERAKPATLLGRALSPYLNSEADVTAATVEKSRAVFRRMFEAGAQNHSALRALMNRSEVEQLRTAVLTTIASVTSRGAQQRVRALLAMVAPTSYFVPTTLPLASCPVLVLFAEREDAVLDAAAPVRLAFERVPRAYFPEVVVRQVRSRFGAAPVQHASLVFHAFAFMPHLQAFYDRMRRGSMPLAA